MFTYKRLLAAALCCAATAGVTACGNDDNGGSTAAPAATTASTPAASTDTGTSGAAGFAAEAQAAVEKGYQGTTRQPPTSGPAAQKGKNVWVISCSQALPGCAGPAAGVKEAGQKLGWKVTIFDGKYNPPSFTTGMKQAISSKADAIITVAMDCPIIKAGLRAAKAAKIPTVGLYSYDCDNPKYGGEKEFTAEMNYGKPNSEFFAGWGKLRADYIIAKKGDKAKVIAFKGPEFLTTVDSNSGFEAEFKKCTECKILDSIDLPAASLASAKGSQIVSTAIAKNPDADALTFTYDAQVLATAQAIKRANKSDMIVVGGEGFIPNMDLIRAGTETASVAFDTAWMGYAGADTANRLIAGETDIPDSGWGNQVIDKEHGLPPKGQPFKSTIDFRSAFEKVWAGQ
jgi:ribose transport system substrate-binding protein